MAAQSHEDVGYLIVRLLDEAIPGDHGNSNDDDRGVQAAKDGAREHYVACFSTSRMRRATIRASPGWRVQEATSSFSL